MLTVRSIERKMREAQIGSEGHDTTAAVAAHHTPGTVGIVITHTEIQLRVTLQNHHAISPDTRMTVTDRHNLLRGQVNVFVPSVCNQEIIPGAVIFIENHMSQYIIAANPPVPRTHPSCCHDTSRSQEYKRGFRLLLQVPCVSGGCQPRRQHRPER